MCEILLFQIAFTAGHECNQKKPFTITVLCENKGTCSHRSHALCVVSSLLGDNVSYENSGIHHESCTRRTQNYVWLTHVKWPEKVHGNVCVHFCALVLSGLALCKFFNALRFTAVGLIIIISISFTFVCSQTHSLIQHTHALVQMPLFSFIRFGFWFENVCKPCSQCCYGVHLKGADMEHIENC